VKKCQPKPHKKIQEIEIRLDQIKRSQKQVRDDQINFEIERKKFHEQIVEKQNNIRENVYQEQNEKEFYQQLQQNLAEQSSQMERDRQSFQLQMHKMQIELDQARKAYEELRRNPATPSQEVHRARSIFVELRQALTEFIYKGFRRIINL